jgi:ribosome-associated toxin RatA of RatAB toxin-antitoxin module
MDEDVSSSQEIPAIVGWSSFLLPAPTFCGGSRTRPRELTIYIPFSRCGKMRRDPRSMPRRAWEKALVFVSKAMPLPGAHRGCRNLFGVRSTSLRWLAVLCFSFISLAPHQGLCSQSDTTSLAEGVKITEEKMSGGRIAIQAVFRIDAPPDQIYRILRDVSRFPEFMPGTREVKILESGEGYQVASFLGDGGLLGSAVVMRRELADPERRISWTLVEGRARELKGFWLVQESEEQGASLVTYLNYVDAGVLVPGAIVRECLKKDIPPMVVALRKRVLSGGTWRSEEYLNASGWSRKLERGSDPSHPR